jgi:arylsulfatase A-like enzyme
VCDQPVISTDFYPTILEIAGLKLQPDQHKDGMSMIPLMTGKTQSASKNQKERALFWFYPHYGNQGGQPGSAIRKGQYKLIEFFAEGTQELYDLSADISEKNNLALSQPAIRQELSDQLHRWQKEVDAVFPERVLR